MEIQNLEITVEAGNVDGYDLFCTKATAEFDIVTPDLQPGSVVKIEGTQDLYFRITDCRFDHQDSEYKEEWFYECHGVLVEKSEVVATYVLGDYEIKDIEAQISKYLEEEYYACL